MENFSDIIEETITKTIKSNIPMKLPEMKSEWFRERGHIPLSLHIKYSDAQEISPDGRQISKKHDKIILDVHSDDGISDDPFSLSISDFSNKMGAKSISNLKENGIESLQNYIAQKMANFNCWVVELTTKNIETDEICEWSRARTKEHHDVFNLVLMKINGQSYKEFTEQQLVFTAADLAFSGDHFCEFKPKTTIGTPTDQSVCV